MGNLFQALLGDEDTDGAISALSKALKDSTVAALDRAEKELLEKAPEGFEDKSGGQTPVIVHILGGDDLLVSVPGAWGFAFCWTYLRAFAEEVASRIGGRSGEVQELPTASAGMVIAHKSFPLSRTVTLADDLLRRAKRGVDGAGTSMAWIDVTRHGMDTSSRHVWVLDEWEQREEALSQIARDWGRARHSSLARDASHPVLEVARARLAVNLHRLEGEDLWDLARDPNRTLEELDIARWWL